MMKAPAAVFFVPTADEFACKVQEKTRCDGYMKSVEVDLSDCKLCEVCVAACPRVFRINDAGYIEVADLDEYPDAEVEDAIRNCPTDCIRWAEQ